MFDLTNSKTLFLTYELEAAGLDHTNYSIYPVIGGDLSKAFALGYIWKDSDDVWKSPLSKMEVLTAQETAMRFNDQVKWANGKIKKEEYSRESYLNFLFKTLFFDNFEEQRDLAIYLGLYYGDLE